jgi:hypothetical protein
MLAVLGSQGAEAVMTIDGATDAEAFWLDGAAVLRPTRRLGDMYDPGQVAFAQRRW